MDALFVAMTLEEVIAETGRSKRTVMRWISQGRLKAYRLDGERVFIRRDVLAVEAATAHRKGRPGARVYAKYVRENLYGNRVNPLRFKEG